MSQRQALQHIVSSTQRLLSTFSLSCHGTRSNVHEQTWPRPPPLSLSDSLDGFRTTVSESTLLPQVSQVVISKATNLASFYERSYQQACQRVLTLPSTTAQETFISSTFSQLAHTYQHLFENVLPRFLAEALRTQSNHNSQQGHEAKPSYPTRHPFNYEYVPFLEKYFACNAYPTSMERLKLARQTEMTPRQIEVWFQNHRNRSKQLGKPLHRRSPDTHCENIQHPLEQSPNLDLSGSDLEFTDEQSCTDEEIEVHGPDAMHCLVTSAAPPHAYPTKYPPRNVSDPFPTKDGRFRFPHPVWRRCIQSQSCNRNTTHVDIEELAIQFASKLHLRETPSRQRTARERTTRTWLPPTVIRPYPAPLPALVRNTPHIVPSARSLPPLTPNPFQPAAKASTSALAKKKPTFPKRLPTWRLPYEVNATVLSFYAATTGRAESRHSSSSSLSSMPATPSTPIRSDGPEIINFLDFDSPPFLAGLYSETTTLNKELHSLSSHSISTSSHCNFEFSEM